MVKKPSDGLRYSIIDKDDTLLNSVIATGAGISVETLNTGKHIFQAFLSSTTTPTATVLVEGSLNGVNWATISTLTLSGSDDSKGDAIDEDWSFIRGNVTAISGTSADVTL